MFLDKNIKINYLKIRKEDIDQYVFLNPSGHLLKVNEMGKKILELSDGTRTINDIINIITNLYDVDYSVAASDIKKFIENLKICGLVSYI